MMVISAVPIYVNGPTMVNNKLIPKTFCCKDYSDDPTYWLAHDNVTAHALIEHQGAIVSGHKLLKGTEQECKDEIKRLVLNTDKLDI